MMPGSLLQTLRGQKPLVHHITNNVTVNDCANATLCVGGLPVMAYAPEEVAEMVAAAGALVLNIGTLSVGQVEAMVVAGRRAKDLGIPVVLDPVGVGATRLRTESAQRILTAVQPDIIKGNQAEISILAGAGGQIRGVESLGEYRGMAATAARLAKKNHCLVVVSGVEDIVTDGQRTTLVQNGHPLLGAVVGTGCMVASVCGCFAAVAKEDLLLGCTAALAVFGLAGELAAQAPGVAGPGTFKAALFDALATFTPAALTAGLRARELTN
ncbi:MAG TPA: hydroxyethylthiazole kinase [Firmicutes bacterium]|jgi:hydroxyethylthiazole kinase|nr:hydroxyethylthiazole kinase [Bacillota bacterium]